MGAELTARDQWGLGHVEEPCSEVNAQRPKAGSVRGGSLNAEPPSREEDPER